MIYNTELVEKVSYGDNFGSCGVIEEIDIREKYVETVMRIDFTEGEHGMFINSEDPNYIMCGYGLYNVSDAIINPTDYVPFMDSYALVLEIGTYNESSKEIIPSDSPNSLKVKLDDGRIIAIIKSNLDSKHLTVDLGTGELSTIESKIVFDNSEKAVKIFTQDLNSEVSTGSMFDFEEWE